MISIVSYFVWNQIKGLWIDSYTRGAGVPLGCPGNKELNGALCYPKCHHNYIGVGPVCWQKCPEGFRDDGAYCAKPNPYTRGCYGIHFGEFNLNGAWQRCRSENPQGCEKGDEACVYGKCKAGFHRVGCCICSPDCPNNMTDIGVSCQKQSYGRTAGKPIDTCPKDLVKDGLLCYPKCKSGYKGVGPVCWENQ